MDLTDLIPATNIMIVSVAASTTTGDPLEEAEWLKIAKACDIALELDDCRKKVTYIYSYYIISSTAYIYLRFPYRSWNMCKVEWFSLPLTFPHWWAVQ